MRKSPQKRAFTLVELMVAMAIIAVLMGLAAFGIAQALRTLRDDQRRNAVRDVETALNAYYADNAEYPAAITLSVNQVTIAANLVVPLEGVAKATGNTNPTADNTPYCYALTTDGYKIGAKLESGQWYVQGTGINDSCVDADIITPT